MPRIDAAQQFALIEPQRDTVVGLSRTGFPRRLLTRGIAIVPVVVVTALYGEKGTGQLLVFSQVILSMQLPFAVIPLVQFVSDRKKMGNLAIPRGVAALAWVVAAAQARRLLKSARAMRIANRISATTMAGAAAAIAAR